MKLVSRSLVITVLTASYGFAAGQVVRVDSRTQLAISLEGADATWSPTTSGSGGPINRVLQNADGKVLFAYGIEATKTDEKMYRLTLTPAKSGPTFRTSRTVEVKRGEDSVRVELLAQAQTGKKIVDVFELSKAEPEEFSLSAQLLRLHNMLYHWLHGE